MLPPRVNKRLEVSVGFLAQSRISVNGSHYLVITSEAAVQ